MRRVREMRARGEEPPPEIRAKLRELFQSGALQRTRPGGSSSAAAARGLGSTPAWRTIYVLATNTPPDGSDPIPAPKAVRVRTGITDGSYTEITEGLKEGERVITGGQAASVRGGWRACRPESIWGPPAVPLMSHAAQCRRTRRPASPRCPRR